mmetsp:Transcript_22823/g.34039  ORF Transcript_22823/g.34039 Transcript_22823/m.34039 type:complete len:239 (+) Transcript_22823:60-776(+)
MIFHLSFLCSAALLTTAYKIGEDSMHLNIHIKVSAQVEATAIKLNSYLQEFCPENDIHLNSTSQPHITLYLTSFDSPSSVVQVAETAATHIKPKVCKGVTLSRNITVSGCYALWNTLPNDCLQYVSDAIVNTTYSFSTPDQPIPDWVENLPEPLRSEKIAMIKKYGSPNVFSQFNPHVTLGFDCTTSCLAEAAKFVEEAGLVPLNITTDITILGIGKVGPHGTVQRGKDLADFDLGGI